jgi:hypothetical protein
MAQSEVPDTIPVGLHCINAEQCLQLLLCLVGGLLEVATRDDVRQAIERLYAARGFIELLEREKYPGEPQARAERALDRLCEQYGIETQDDTSGRGANGGQTARRKTKSESEES